MKNPFGAKISQTVDSSLQQFLVVFDKSKSLDSRRHDVRLSTQHCEQVFFIDQKAHFLMAIANQTQADQVKKLATVSTVGGINIDFERFQKIITGNIQF